MTPFQNDTFLRALYKEPVAHTPIWLMRQAGRYLPEYRALRAKAGSFMAMCQNPELAAEVTLQPLERFPLDAAILFSDILTIPDAMGLGLSFVNGEGPRFEKPLQNEQDVFALTPPDMGKLRYVFDAAAASKKALQGKVPLIGFSGSPWTLACYMIEGAGSRDFAKARAMFYARPDLIAHLMKTLTVAVTDYLNAQIASGVSAVMIFDSWGGVLSQEAYQAISLASMREIIGGLHKTWEGARIPTILFSKGAGASLKAQADVGATALGLDWQTDLAAAHSLVGDKVALQGNLDPAILLSSPDIIEQEAQKCLASFPDKSGHIFNLGHGVLQNTPIANIAALVSAVRAFSKKAS